MTTDRKSDKLDGYNASTLGNTSFTNVNIFSNDEESAKRFLGSKYLVNVILFYKKPFYKKPFHKKPFYKKLVLDMPEY